MQKKARRMFAAAFAITAVAGGALLGSPRASGAQPFEGCDNNVCNLDSGNCEIHVLNYNCDELAGSPGCKSSQCAAS
jgi:hypothetical protein